jgi:hypothetical protein
LRRNIWSQGVARGWSRRAGRSQLAVDHECRFVDRSVHALYAAVGLDLQIQRAGGDRFLDRLGIVTIRLGPVLLIHMKRLNLVLPVRTPKSLAFALQAPHLDGRNLQPASGRLGKRDGGHPRRGNRGKEATPSHSGILSSEARRK